MGTHLRVLRERAIQWIPTRQSLEDFQKLLCPCALDDRSPSIRENKIFFDEIHMQEVAFAQELILL